MKYISMKMLPKGSSPPASATTHGRRYHFLSGMGLGMRFTLHEGKGEAGLRACRQEESYAFDGENPGSDDGEAGRAPVDSTSLLISRQAHRRGRPRDAPRQWQQRSAAHGSHLQGLSGVPFQLRPTTVPNRHRGNETNIQISSTTTIDPNGTCARAGGGQAEAQAERLKRQGGGVS